MAGRFEGKVAWITGAGSGIGRALAIELARQGATVAVSGRRPERLEEVAREIEALGRKALPVTCDVTEESDVARAVETVVAELGKLDVAVANAGFGVTGSIATLTAEDWRRQLDTNVVGAAMTAKHALPHLLATKGRVVLVGSVSALLATPNSGAYTASKYAVRAIGQTLAIELAGTGVTCTLVHPGFVESEIGQVDNAGRYDASRKDKRPQGVMWPAGRAAKSIARAIDRRAREHVFTGHGKLGAAIGQHAPGLAQLILSSQSAKKRAADMDKKRPTGA